jgi:prophage regulatory protein
MPPTAERLLDKWAIEDRTSLDITTIYRKIKAGTFPAPVRIGIRRVAWRESDVVKWQQNLVQGVGSLRLTTLKTTTPPRPPTRRGRR